MYSWLRLRNNRHFVSRITDELWAFVSSSEIFWIKANSLTGIVLPQNFPSSTETLKYCFHKSTRTVGRFAVCLSRYQRQYPYKHVGRTLCQPPTRAASETQYFFVDVSTLSSQGTNYQLRVSRVESFTLQWVTKQRQTAAFMASVMRGTSVGVSRTPATLWHHLSSSLQNRQEVHLQCITITTSGKHSHLVWNVSTVKEKANTSWQVWISLFNRKMSPDPFVTVYWFSFTTHFRSKPFFSSSIKSIFASKMLAPCVLWGCQVLLGGL